MTYRTNCLGCGKPYLNQNSSQNGTWWHFRDYRGPAPLQGLMAPVYSLTGSMCASCADKYAYKTQTAFEGFIKTLQVTNALSKP